MVSLVRTSFVGLIKARFPGRAGILQTAHPACPDASHPVYTVPMHTLPASTTSNDDSTDTRNKTLINLSEIRLPSVQSDFENPTVVVSPPWSRGSPNNALPAQEVEVVCSPPSCTTLTFPGAQSCPKVLLQP